MNVVVTGSHGLIGGALVERLTLDGHRVIRLVRHHGVGIPPDPAGPVVDLLWDPPAGTIDSRGLDEAGPIDGVVHLAGAGIFDSRWTERRRAEILDSRVQSTELLARTLTGLDRVPSLLVSGSAIGFYGDRGVERLTEESTEGAGFLAEVCRQWEGATSPAAGAGIRVVTLRTGVVLSSKGGALAKQLPLFRFGLGGKLGRGRQYLSWISLDDEVGAILWCLGHPELAGPVNATAPVPVTNAQFTAELGRVLHRPAVMTVPAFALRQALGRDRVDEMLLSGQQVLPAKLVASGFSFSFPDLRSALAELLGDGRNSSSGTGTA